MNMSENKEEVDWIEKWTVALISFAALLTAWCAYQANLWTGDQEFNLSDAQKWEIESTKAFLDHQQHHMMDGIISLSIIQALADKRSASVNEILNRSRHELRSIITDWLALDPLNNKNAPPHPLAMPKYLSDVLDKARHGMDSLRDVYRKSMAKAKTASSISDSYILYTVLLAMVLFFGGISPTLHSQRMRKVILICAILIFFLTLGNLVFTPINSG